MQVDFDPDQISYEAIVNMFWQSHNPISAQRGSQYMSAIWFADDDQLDAINSSKEPLVQRFEQALTTPVLPLATFYDAEDYHQKYGLQRHKSLMKTFSAMYPDFRGFINSTAAARLNGFSSGRGSQALFEVEKNDYGFSQVELDKIMR